MHPSQDWEGAFRAGHYETFSFRNYLPVTILRNNSKLCEHINPVHAPRCSVHDTMDPVGTITSGE